MKGNLALDTIMMWIILLVVAGVAIGIIFHYSSEIKSAFTGLGEEEPPETEMFEADIFSESQIKTYIELCWEKTGDRFNENFICYILKGSIAHINPKEFEGNYEDYQVISNFNSSKGILTIRFEDIGNKIILEN